MLVIQAFKGHKAGYSVSHSDYIITISSIRDIKKPHGKEMAFSPRHSGNLSRTKQTHGEWKSVETQELI